MHRLNVKEGGGRGAIFLIWVFAKVHFSCFHANILCSIQLPHIPSKRTVKQFRSPDYRPYIYFFIKVYAVYSFELPRQHVLLYRKSENIA